MTIQTFQILIISAFFLAIFLDVMFVHWMRRHLNPDDNRPSIRFLGSTSLFLTWLVYWVWPGIKAAYHSVLAWFHPGRWIRAACRLTMDWLRPVTWLRLMSWLAFALALAVFGQIFLAAQYGIWLGILLYIIAGMLFMRVIEGAGKCPPISHEERATIQRYFLPFIFVLAGTFLLIRLLPRVNDPDQAGSQNYRTLIYWLISIGCFSTAVLIVDRWSPPVFRSLRQSWRDHHWEWVLVAGLFVAAFGLRLYKLDQYPYPALTDEYELGTEASKILHGSITNLFESGWSQDPVSSSIPEAISIGLFGNTVLALRLVPAFIGALSIVLLYFLARAMFDKLTAFLAVQCLLTIPPYLHFSRIGVNNIFIGFWAVAVLWLTYRAIQSGRSSDYLFAGLTAGFSLYSYVGNRLVPFLAGAMLLFCIFSRRGFGGTYWRQLVVFCVALVFVSAPIMYFYYRHPGLFTMRFRADDIFHTRWLISEPINSGHSIAAAFLEQIRKSTLVYISEGASNFFYNSSQPYLSLIEAILFVFGLIYSLFHLRELRYFLLHAWFWAIVILGSVLLLDPPSTERTIGNLPSVAIFCGIGLAQIAGLLKRINLASPRLVNSLAIGIMMFASVNGVLYYFGDFQKGFTLVRPAEEFESAVSLYVRSLGPNYRLYLLVPTPMRADYFPAHDYLNPQIPVEDLEIVSPEFAASLPKDTGLIFVAVRTREAALEALANLLPGGRWQEVPRQPIPGLPREILYYSYQWVRPSTGSDPAGGR